MIIDCEINDRPSLINSFLSGAPDFKSASRMNAQGGFGVFASALWQSDFEQSTECRHNPVHHMQFW
jgi:hypothetical protein